MNYISMGAFCGCKALKSIKIPKTMPLIEDHTFSGCGFEEIVIPNGVTTICHGAFGGCKNLRKVILPTSVDVIEEFAFGDCINLEEINLRVCTFLGPDAFRNCDKITIDREKMIWTGYYPINDCYCRMCEEKLEKLKVFNMPQADGSFKKVNCVHWYCKNCQTRVFKYFQFERMLKIRRGYIYE